VNYERNKKGARFFLNTVYNVQSRNALVPLQTTELCLLSVLNSLLWNYHTYDPTTLYACYLWMVRCNVAVMVSLASVGSNQPWYTATIAAHDELDGWLMVIQCLA